ncbi:CoA-acylating methylmalonate-semialdehyde dehydrogenase [Rhizorhabdus wittichii]|uniref:CoA-acylating methylmalonate-semialdehyde dehydrogenase n=1 Tax=Rhizorhabdus wittichii TaxID=160791 RepID=UPI00031E317A|nr:CoA-acylating methylmalonate-semialdehyde dehydrogenase [Rhizorhabdus wittichii]
MDDIAHFIAGEPYYGEDDRSGPVFNPSNGSTLYQCRYASTSTLDHAVEVAIEAGRGWANASQARRLAVIFAMRQLVIDNSNELARLIGREHGKTIADAKGEIHRGLEALEFATNAAQVTKGEYSYNVSGGIDAFSIRQPVGIVGCIAPFNFPAMVPLMMTAMAIACGNAVILKPSERVPGAAAFIGDLWRQAGLPDGVWNAVNGDKEVVDAMLEHPRIAAISFVGSTRIGEYIYHRGCAHNKRVAAYTGGKNHMVVMADADLEQAASAFVSAAYGSSSQRCMAVSLLVAVGDDTAEQLRSLIVPKIEALHIGAYDDPKADFGAVITADAKRTVEQAISDAVAAGAELVIDGRGFAVPGLERGFFTGATLLDRITTDMDFWKTEIFGPARGIVRAQDLDEAIAITNAHEYGNGAVIFTQNGHTAHRFVTEVEAGMLGVNVSVPVPVGHHNFGGLRRSKFGDAHMYGPDAARFYTKIKSISQRWPVRTQSTIPLSLAFPSNH